MKLDTLLKILNTLDKPEDCEVTMDEYWNLTVTRQKVVVVRIQIVPELVTQILTRDPLPGSMPDKAPSPVIDSDKFRYAGPGKKGIDWLLGRSEKK